jgi:FtsP/CotA-like multicopper oxidase with cupredoxin domain
LEYLGLADYLLIAEAVLGIPAEEIACWPGIGLADSALHAPAAAFESVELFPDLIEKAAVLCVRLARNHPLPDGNKRVPYLAPPEPLPHQRGRVREYEIAAVDREIEVASGVSFAAWTYNGTVPGPVLRATEDDLLRVRFVNAGSHPHTIHFHGIHPATMDGVFEIVEPGDSYTYEFPARPYGMQLYHCHSTPLKKHIAKGLYGAAPRSTTRSTRSACAALEPCGSTSRT